MSFAASRGSGLPFGPFGVHVDESHLDGTEGIRELAITAVTLVTEPRRLGSPVDALVGFVDVLASTAEAEGRKAHRLERDVARQDEEVRPGDLASVLLLDRPEQTARLVEADVVGPTVEGREALCTGSRAAAAVVDAIGPRAVPRHANEERTVVTEVSGPPLLGVGHQRREVLLQGVEVERLELLGVVEVLVHGTRTLGVGVEDLQVQTVRPPQFVWLALGVHSVRERALALDIRHFSPLVLLKKYARGPAPMRVRYCDRLPLSARQSGQTPQ